MDIKIGPVRLYSHHLGDYMRRWILLTPVGTARQSVKDVGDYAEMADRVSR